MKKLFIIVFAALTGVFSASCLHDSFKEGYSVPGGKAGADFRLKLSVDGVRAEAATRTSVAPTTGEEDVQDLALLFFEQSSSRTGLYCDAIILTAPSPASPYLMNTDIPVSFTGTSLDQTLSYNILIVANAGTGYADIPMEDWVRQFEGQTEQDAYDDTRVVVRGASDDTYAIAPNKIIMTGSATYVSGQSTVTSVLTRGVSRFDVVNSQRAEYDLVSTSIWNAFQTSSVFGGGTIDYTGNRTSRYYGVQSVDGADIVGGLYAFENRVVAPEKRDDLTTCLIVALAPKADVTYYDNDNREHTWAAGDAKYYRVNIHPKESAQALKRNNVYKLTIRGVVGPGYDSEAEAHKGDDNNLSYVINYWDLDDDGLVVYDGKNLLAIPTKTVRLSGDGETRSLSIFTFGDGTLAIKSQSYNGSDKIKATLNGNTLNIVAQPLAGETERKGLIILAFGGLEATINVIQSGNSGLFLEVITPDGSGIPPFQPLAWESSGNITVKASGPWTATIHMEGFSFVKNSNITTLTSTDAPGNVFQIHTTSENDDSMPREAFVLIKLDEDPDNYNSALLLTQKSQGAIDVSPDKRMVAFKSNRSLDMSQGSYSRAQVFNVYPNIDNGIVQDWNIEVMKYSDAATDDRDRFEVYDPSTNAAGIQKSATNPEDNRFGIRPVAQNGSTREYKIRLKVYLVAEPNVYTEFEVIQKSLDLTNTVIDPVPVDGGISQTVYLETSNDMKWKFVSIETYTLAPNTLIGHTAIAIEENISPDKTILETSKVWDLSEGFKVVFPKVFYPNRNRVIYADVTLALVNANNPDMELSRYTVTVEQEMLKPNNVVISNYHGSGSEYGGLYSDGKYSEALRNRLRNIFGTTGVELANFPATLGYNASKVYSPNAISIPSSLTSGVVPSATTYIHASMANQITASNTNNINTWRGEDRGVLFVVADEPVSNITSLLTSIECTGAGDANVSASVILRNTSDKKIRDFIYFKGPFGPVGSDSSLSWKTDSRSQAVNIGTGSTAVAILGADNRASIVIDPVNRVVFLGESQLFSDRSDIASNAADLTKSKGRLLANIMAYAVYTAQYGSHFSDMFKE